MKFTFDVVDIDPNIASIVISAENRDELDKLIDDVGLDQIIRSPEDYSAVIEWADDLHQPNYSIVGPIKSETEDSDNVRDPNDPDNRACDKHHADKDDA